MRKNILLTLILLIAIISGSALIWQGFNLDKQSLTPREDRQVVEEKVLGQKTDTSVFPSPSVATSSGSIEKNKFLVTKVFDGDTIQIKIDGKPISVRLIGIDTPETIDPRRPVGCFGKAASEETKRLLEGKVVILTKDISETDKYNRLLRYVYLPLGDGHNLFINDYLVRQGFAKSYTYPPDVKYDERFKSAEAEAGNNLRGLWNECR